MSFYYYIFSVACLEEEKKMPKMAKNGKNYQKKINLSNDGNRRPPPPKMDVFHHFLFEGFPYSTKVIFLDFEEKVTYLQPNRTFQGHITLYYSLGTKPNLCYVPPCICI